MILYIKHIGIEGPETLGYFFEEKGIDSLTINALEGDIIPDDPRQFDAIVVLGGPMNVYEEDKYPALKEENVFIQKVLEEKIPYMGLCLGAQLLAKAAGAKVVKSPVKEIGWFDIQLKEDPLFNGLGDSLEVFHWHEDMFELPLSATLIATAAGCPHQAFRMGTNAYGLQFHIEITGDNIDAWSQSYANDKIVERKKMLSRYAEIRESFDQKARKLYTNFYKIVKEEK